MSLICTKFRNIGMMFSPNLHFPVLFDVINIKIFMLSIKRTYFMGIIFDCHFLIHEIAIREVENSTKMCIFEYIFDNYSCSLKINYVTIYLLSILYRCLNNKLLKFLKRLCF